MITYEGEVVYKDPAKNLKKYKVMVASREAEIECLKIVISEKDDEIKKLNEKITAQKGTIKYYRDRLSTTHQKLRKQNENSVSNDGV
jgi:uncharacterized coiled-coil protein SlyX